MQPENIRAIATTIQTLNEARSAVAKKASIYLGRSGSPSTSLFPPYYFCILILTWLARQAPHSVKHLGCYSFWLFFVFSYNKRKQNKKTKQKTKTEKGKRKSRSHISLN